MRGLGLPKPAHGKFRGVAAGAEIDGKFQGRHGYAFSDPRSKSGRKAFFFEKKNQKTITSSGRCWRKVRDSDQKFFGSFFQKRTFFLLPNAKSTKKPVAMRVSCAYAQC
jgi:hypothetical protein